MYLSTPRRRGKFGSARALKLKGEWWDQQGIYTALGHIPFADEKQKQKTGVASSSFNLLVGDFRAGSAAPRLHRSNRDAQQMR
jgi:hypothetical protein